MTVSPRSITWIRRLLLGAAVLVTLLAAALVEEDWRGNRDWRRTEARYAARHESLRLDAFTGPAIPDRENLFRAPIWSDLISDRIPVAQYPRVSASAGLGRVEEVRAISMSEPDLSVARGQMIRAGLLPKDDTRPTPQAVLAGLEPAAALCDGLRVAVRERPLAGAEARLPFDFGHVRLGAIFNVGQVLTFRARAELAAGKPEEAYADTYTALRIARATEMKPATLLEGLVAIAIVDRASGVIKDALATHAWTEPQVAELQAALADIRSQTYLATGIRTERASMIAAIDAFPSLTREQRHEMELPRWLPAGWLQENKVAVCDLLDREIAVVEACGTAGFTSELQQLQQYASRDGKHWRPGHYFIRNLAQRIRGVLRGYCLAVDAMNGGVLAMALERYYLTAGHYPGRLDALAPKYLAAIPRLSTGEEFGYRPTANGAGFELHETPDNNDKPRAWIQPSSPEAAAGARKPPMTELERRRELRRQSQKHAEQRE